MIIKQNSQWKAVFDIWMLGLVGYSCFTTIFYVAFGMPSNNAQMYFDWVVFGFFFMDLILNFFVEYNDLETFQTIRDHKKIAKRYVFSFFFMIDFVSTFPFEVLMPTNGNGNNTVITRLFRLFRLPKLIRLLDLYRFNQLLKSFFSSSTRKDRIVAQYILMYSYKIFRLIIIAIIITYFVGCFWYLISKELNSANDIAD
jgi:hypothetical protein